MEALESYAFGLRLEDVSLENPTFDHTAMELFRRTHCTAVLFKIFSLVLYDFFQR